MEKCRSCAIMCLQNVQASTGMQQMFFRSARANRETREKVRLNFERELHVWRLRRGHKITHMYICREGTAGLCKPRAIC